MLFDGLFLPEDFFSKWKTREAWENWYKPSERKNMQNKIDELLGTKTEYEIYDYD